MTYLKHHALARSGIYLFVGALLLVFGILTRNWGIPDYMHVTFLHLLVYVPAFSFGFSLMLFGVLTLLFFRPLDKRPHVLTSYISVLSGIPFAVIFWLLVVAAGFSSNDTTTMEIIVSILPFAGLIFLFFSGLFVWYWFNRVKQFSFLLVLYDLLTVLVSVPVWIHLVSCILSVM